jgi:glycerate kinase
LATLVHALNGKTVTCDVTDPLGRPIQAEFGVIGQTAVIELAAASGLTLLSPEERNPWYTTTYGTGQLICQALDMPEINEIIVTIGGSATNDLGIGMAQALGLQALDINGTELPSGGGSLRQLHRLDITNMHPRIKEVPIRTACDVTNPLCGKTGASYVYGFQKGASSAMIEELDQNLRHAAMIIKRNMGFDILDVPGAGAAGGVGAGLIAFCGATLQPGIEIVLDLLHFDDYVQQADLVITGEGMTDFQTAFGKAPAGVAKRAKQYNKPVICLSGALGKDYQQLYSLGIDAFFSICNKPLTEEEAMKGAFSYLKEAAENIIRYFRWIVQDSSGKRKAPPMVGL